MHVRAFGDAAALECGAECTLQTAAGDGASVVREAMLQSVAGRGREQPRPRAVRSPVGAQHLEDRLGQWHVAVLLGLAVDVQEHPRAVHVGHLQVSPFQQAKPTGVDRGETRPIDRNAHLGQNAAHLLTAQHHRQLLLAGRAHKLERAPVLMQRVLVEELDCAQRDGGGGASDLLLVGEVQKVLAQILLAELVGAPVVMCCQLPHRVHVALLRACGQSPELHVFNHALA